jgi:chromosome segregation ATPase
MTTSTPNTFAPIARTLAVFAERIVELEESLKKAEADRDTYRTQWVFTSRELDEERASRTESEEQQVAVVREECDRKVASAVNSLTAALRHVNDERERLLAQNAAALTKVEEMLQHRTCYAISDTAFQPLNELYKTLLPLPRDVE